MKYCKYCGKELNKDQRHNLYCNMECQKAFEQKEYINRWKNGQESGKRGAYGVSNYIKNYLFEKNNNKCEICGWGEINQFTGLIPLEIHHKDGNHENLTEENLQLLCPNCHSLTNNFKSRGGGTRTERRKYDYTGVCVDCGIPITTHSLRCHDCEVKHRAEEFINNLPISREELKRRIRVESFESIGRDYKISGNGLKRWMTKYGLPNTKTEIKKYSDEEWEKI